MTGLFVLSRKSHAQHTRVALVFPYLALPG